MNQQLCQSFDDLTSAGGGRASERAANAARRTERRTRAKVKSAAETAQAAGETLGTRAETWAEEARIEGATAARAGERAVRDVSLGINETTGDRYAETVRNTAARIGSIVGRARSLHGEDLAAEIKRFVGQHPSSLLGALAAGFFLGRMIRGR